MTIKLVMVTKFCGILKNGALKPYKGRFSLAT